MRKSIACALLAAMLCGCGGGKDLLAPTGTTTTTASFLDAPIWTGVFATTSEALVDRAAHLVCPDKWRGVLSFAVDENGAVSGEGRADLRVPRSCDNAGVGLLFRVTGRADRRLQLRLTGAGTIPENATLATGMAALLMHGPRLQDPGGPLLTMTKTDACHAGAELTMDATIFDGAGPRRVRVRARFELTCG